MVEDDDNDTEGLEIFEKESDDIEIIEELINLGNPSSCQLFSVEEWRKYNQLASYYLEVKIDSSVKVLVLLRGTKATCVV